MIYNTAVIELSHDDLEHLNKWEGARVGSCYYSHPRMSIGRALTIALAVFQLSACIFGGDDIRHERVPEEEVKNLRLSDTGAALPDGATNVIIVERHFQDTLQFIRFDADSDKAAVFLREFLEGKDPVLGYEPGIAGHLKADWWLQALPKGARGGKVDRVGMAHYAIVLDKGGKSRVWIELLDR